MSVLSKFVPFNEMTPFLLTAIRWVPFDPDQKYPLAGRLDYVWMSEDYKTIKLLLRDAESSWSEMKKEVMDQIKRHETFVSVKEHEEDNTYLVAEFLPISDWEWVERIDPESTGFTLQGARIGTLNSKQIAGLTQVVLERISSGDLPPIDITTDPIVLFKKETKLAFELMEAGVDTEAIAEVKKKFQETMEQEGNVKIFRI